MSSRPSEEAVREATGQGWNHWFGLLAEAEEEAGEEWSHQELVGFLEAGHRDVVSGWWRQMIVNEYEKHADRRVTGETADGGFQVGVSRTLGASREVLWEAITAPDGLAAWLGDGIEMRFEEGAGYAAGADSAPGEEEVEQVRRATPAPHGEVRVVVPEDRVRLTWQPGGWPRPSTLQVRLSESRSGKTTVTIHHEHLPDLEAREAMRARWKGALSAIAERVG